MRPVILLAFHKTIFFYCLVLLSITACGGGGSSPPAFHTVTISWAANLETAVNRSGGGYTVNISGQPSIDVPYILPGPLAPTFITTSLFTGNYTVTVVAYSTLNPLGSTSGSVSAASAPITVNVP